MSSRPFCSSRRRCSTCSAAALSSSSRPSLRTSAASKGQSAGTGIRLHTRGVWQWRMGNMALAGAQRCPCQSACMCVEAMTHG
eukprot:365413-Chlamydomonas_euryale.AAC.8